MTIREGLEAGQVDCSEGEQNSADLSETDLKTHHRPLWGQWRLLMECPGLVSSLSVPDTARYHG